MYIIEKIKNTELIIIAGYLFLTLGLIVVIQNILAISRAKASLNWEKTKGKILSSELNVDKSGGSSDVITYSPKIEYEYSVNNHIYKSDRVYFGQNISTSNRGYSQSVIDKYAKDEEVDVYYKKTKEKMSVLEPGVQSNQYLGFVLGLIISISGFLFLYYSDYIISINQ